MININDCNPTSIKVDKKLCKGILIYCIGYETSDGVKPLHIIFNKLNGYIEDNNGGKYLTLIPFDENKKAIKKCIGIWNEIEYLIE